MKTRTVTSVDTAEVRVSRRSVPHILGKQGRAIREIEDVCGVLLGVRDSDEQEAVISMVGPSDRLPFAEFVIETMARGIVSILPQLRHFSMT